MQKTIQRCRQLGYFVSLNFIFLGAPDQCIERIRVRVGKGGHFVPDDDVKRRYIRSLNNFWDRYRLLASKWELIYNSGEGFELVATGVEEQLMIRDEGLFRIFEAARTGAVT